MRFAAAHGVDHLLGQLVRPTAAQVNIADVQQTARVGTGRKPLLANMQWRVQPDFQSTGKQIEFSQQNCCKIGLSFRNYVATAITSWNISRRFRHLITISLGSWPSVRVDHRLFAIPCGSK